jgi:aspartate dehydrogenase
MRNIGIVGCGTIGSEVALTIDKKEIHMNLVTLYDVDKKRAIDLLGRLMNTAPKLCDNLDQAISDVDIVFESTKVDEVKNIAEKCFLLKKDIFIMSVGSLITCPGILDMARDSNCKVYFPTGAIIGLDGIVASKISGIKSVNLRTTKPLRSLEDAPGLIKFLKAKQISLEDIINPQLIFRGNVIEAIRLFPQNVNVAATLAIVGIGPENTVVEIVADPHSNRNIHEIECISAAGNLYSRAENVPHPENPKTSFLAVLSAIRKLKEL